MTSTYRELYGPQDPSILTCQETHRSELIARGNINEDETLRVNQLIVNIFWTFRIDDPTRVRLHPRVLDLLYDMGFYHVARCGAMIIDAHLITTLVERWRPETHIFHFPIGEATVTFWYCIEFLGFTPLDTDFKSKTRIKLSTISSHLLDIEIFDDTDQEIVDQYARRCVLLMLGSYMFLDSSPVAGTYSWGSALLAYLYRELCNAAESEKTTIGGVVWAWSRIPAIQPTNHGDRLLQGPIEGANGRILGLPPYGSSYVRSTRFSIRVYRDMFDRINEGDFN
ncbi:hypothetical protein ACS0TY_029382 [Phlomoides rotata]